MSGPQLTFAAYWTKKAVDGLFRAETNRLDGLLGKLVDQQVAITGLGDACYGFLYQGKHFVNPPYRDMKLPKLPTIHTSLSNELYAFMDDYENIEKDKAGITQLFGIMFRHLQSDQEIRNALPECVVKLAGLDHLPRTQPISFEHTTPQFKQQYEKWLPKIEMYSVTNLLY